MLNFVRRGGAASVRQVSGYTNGVPMSSRGLIGVQFNFVQPSWALNSWNNSFASASEAIQARTFSTSESEKVHGELKAEQVGSKAMRRRLAAEEAQKVSSVTADQPASAGECPGSQLVVKALHYPQLQCRIARRHQPSYLLQYLHTNLLLMSKIS